MSKMINEIVSVMSFYDRNREASWPVKFSWHGRMYRVKQVGYHWPIRDGITLIHTFSVVTDTNTSFKLSLNTDNLQWVLEEVMDKFTD